MSGLTFVISLETLLLEIISNLSNSSNGIFSILTDSILATGGLFFLMEETNESGSSEFTFIKTPSFLFSIVPHKLFSMAIRYIKGLHHIFYTNSERRDL